MAISLADLRDEYQRTYDIASIRPERDAAVRKALKTVLKGRRQYELASVATGVPWGVIAVLHYRESDCDFTTHLHNGDPLTARTRHVPPNRPAYGRAPFEWHDSAADALRYDRIDDIVPADRWDVCAAAYACEVLNGFGYRHLNRPSAYLWAGTTAYERGKYNEDGHYDASMVDQQSGAMAVLKLLLVECPECLKPASTQVKPAPAKESVPVAEAVKSPSMWAIAVATTAKVADSCHDTLAGLLSVLPDVKADVETQLDGVKSLLGVAGLGLETLLSPPVLTAAIFASLAYAAYRRLLPRGA